MFFEKSLVKFLGVGALNFVSSACLPAADSLPGGCVSPAQARFRSAKNAAVLRLQRTQSKDRRFSKAFAGDTHPPGRESAAGKQAEDKKLRAELCSVKGGRKGKTGKRELLFTQYCAFTAQYVRKWFKSA